MPILLQIFFVSNFCRISNKDGLTAAEGILAKFTVYVFFLPKKARKLNNKRFKLIKGNDILSKKTICKCFLCIQLYATEWANRKSDTTEFSKFEQLKFVANFRKNIFQNLNCWHLLQISERIFFQCSISIINLNWNYITKFIQFTAGSTYSYRDKKLHGKDVTGTRGYRHKM